MITREFLDEVDNLTEKPPLWMEAVEKRLQEAYRRIEGVEHRFPVNRYSRNLVKEGHIHEFIAGLGTNQYDYIISSSYTGSAGATFTDTTGHTTRVYATIGAAMAHAATLSAGSHRSFLILGGTYSETVSVTAPSNTRWTVHGVGAEVTTIAATANGQTLLNIGMSVLDTSRLTISGISFDLGSFTTAFGINARGSRVFAHDCTFVTGGATSSAGIFSSGSVGSAFISFCSFTGSGIGVQGTNGIYTIDQCRFQCTIGVQGVDHTNNCIFVNCTTAVDGIETDGSVIGCRISGATTGIAAGAGSLLKIIGNYIAATVGVTWSGLATDSFGHVVTGNTFQLGSLGDIGIQLDSNVISGSIFGNNFYGYASGNEIAGSGGAALDIFHNQSTTNLGVNQALADVGAPVGHLPAAGTAAIVVEEDNAVVAAGAATIDFTEPDATLTSVSGSAPNQEVDVNMALYAMLTGRSGGQTLRGGTGASEVLTLESTSHATKGSVRLPSGETLNLAHTVASGDVLLTSGGSRTLRMHSSTIPPQLKLRATADTQDRVVLGQPGLQFGPGGSTAPDTVLVRGQAGRWNVTSLFVFPEIATPTMSPALSDQIGLYAKDFAGVARLFQQDDSAREIGPLGLNLGNFGNLSYPIGWFQINEEGTSSLAAFNGDGTLSAPTVEGTVNTSVMDTNLLFFETDTGSTINTDAGIRWPIHLELSGQVLVYAFRVSAVTSLRAFIGWTDQTFSTMLGSDNPAGNYIGLQFSTARGDANWQYVQKDGITQTLTNSGVAASNDIRIFKLQYIPGAIIGTLYNVSWVVQGTAQTIGGTISAGTSFRPMAVIRNLAASSRTLRHAFGYEVSQP